MDKQQLKIKEPGIWEIQDGHLAFPGSLTDLIFIWWAKAFHGCSINALTMSSPFYIYMLHWTKKIKF